MKRVIIWFYAFRWYVTAKVCSFQCTASAFNQHSAILGQQQKAAADSKLGEINTDGVTAPHAERKFRSWRSELLANTWEGINSSAAGSLCHRVFLALSGVAWAWLPSFLTFLFFSVIQLIYSIRASYGIYASSVLSTPNSAHNNLFFLSFPTHSTIFASDLWRWLMHGGAATLLV